jgi:hypothetical protein
LRLAVLRFLSHHYEQGNVSAQPQYQRWAGKSMSQGVSGIGRPVGGEKSFPVLDDILTEFQCMPIE